MIIIYIGESITKLSMDNTISINHLKS